MTKRMTAKDRLLARLRFEQGRWVSGVDLASPNVAGLRYGARIYDARKDGHVIEERRSKRSAVSEYRLVEGPEQLTLPVAS